MSSALRTLSTLAIAGILLGACADGPLGSDAELLAPPAATLIATTPGGGLLSCPAGEGWSDTITVDDSGAIYERHGVRIAVPAGAVPGPTRLDIAAPSSSYIEIDVTANRQAHYQFLQPITITLPLDRCRRAGGVVRASGAWNIEAVTKRPLEFMGGVVDPTRWTVTFQTDHLSGYAIAN